MKNPNISANEFYNDFIGTETYYKYLLGLLLTDGVNTVAEKENCFWFLDCIASYQLEKICGKEEFLIWQIQQKKNNTYKLTATNGNNKVLITQDIEYSDFFFNELTIWKENNVLLLPSEH